MGIPRSHGGGGWTDGSGRRCHVDVALSEGTRETNRPVKMEGARQRVNGQQICSTGGAGCGLPWGSRLRRAVSMEDGRSWRRWRHLLGCGFMCPVVGISQQTFRRPCPLFFRML